MTNSRRAQRAILTAAALLAPTFGAALVYAQTPEAAAVAKETDSTPTADSAVDDRPIVDIRPIVDVDRLQRRVL